MINFFDIFGPQGVQEGPGLPTEAAAFMNTVASNESKGKWNVIFTPKGKVQTFSDYSKHPRVFNKILKGPNAGKYSSAAGKFQITSETYNRVAPKLGITDFSPMSQARIAWYLAEEAYKNKTGGNLLEVLKSGDAEEIKKAARSLNKVWTSLPGGIEQLHTSASFIDEYNRQVATGTSMIPKVGLNGELIAPGDEIADSIMGYAPFEMAALKGRLPTELKEQTREAIQRHNSIVKEVGQLLDKGIMVPNGTRNLKNTASTVLDFPAADLIAAGLTSEGLKAIPADPKGPLPKPSPLAPWGNLPTTAGKVVAPGVIDVGGGALPSSSPKPAAPTSTGTVSYPKVKPYTPIPKAPVQGLKLPVAPKGPVKGLKLPVLPATSAVKAATKPVVAPVTPKSSASSQPVLSPGDQRLANLVKTLQTPVQPPSIEKSKGIAGTATLPKDYKPPAGIIPGTEPKPKPGALPALPPAPKPSGNPANTTGAPKSAPKSPISAPPNVVPVVAKATGAKTNAPVSLSNPVLKPIAAMKPETKVTQTTTKPVDPETLKTIEKILAPTPAVKPPAKSPMPAAQMAAGLVPGVPAKKPVVQPAVPTQKVTSSLKPTGSLLESGSSVVKTVKKPKAGEVIQGELKDLNPDGTAKVGGAQTKKKPTSPLDILGDIFLNGGAKTVDLLGDALLGQPTRDLGQAQRARTLADLAAGRPVTLINRIKAEFGYSSAQAYNSVINNYGAGGFTSSGQSRTLPSGESWAAGNPTSATGGGPAAGGEYGGGGSSD